MTDSTTIKAASRQGRDAAAELDRALRAEELRCFEEELERRRTGSGGHLAGVDHSILRLESELELLRNHRAAIEASRVWRSAQFLRRLFGRAW